MWKDILCGDRDWDEETTLLIWLLKVFSLNVPWGKKSHIFTLLKIKYEQRPPFHMWDKKKKFSNARGDHENISTRKQKGISKRGSDFSHRMLCWKPIFIKLLMDKWTELGTGYIILRMNHTYSHYTNNSKYTKLPHYPNVLQPRINMHAIFN